MLAILGKKGHQDADALCAHRSVRWIARLSMAVSKLMEAEKAAMDAAARRD